MAGTKMSFNELFTSLIETTNDVVIITDARCLDEGGPRIVYVNRAFEELMGYRADEVLGHSPRLLNGPDTDSHTRSRIRKALREGASLRTEILKYSKSGQPRWLDMNLMPLKDGTGAITHFACIERDLTRYKKMQRQLAQMAMFDSLTGALSRPALFQHADKEFNRAKRYHRPLSVIMLDIDHFKRINDQYGHQAGDNVLEIFVEACEEITRETDLLGRIGGEEFVLLLPDTPLNSAYYLAERLRERINKYPYLAADMLIEVTASLGVAELQDGDDSFKALLHRVDEALYDAKHSGRNRVKLAA